MEPMFGQVGSNCWRSPEPEVPLTSGQSRPLDLFSREEVNTDHTTTPFKLLPATTHSSQLVSLRRPPSVWDAQGLERR